MGSAGDSQTYEAMKQDEPDQRLVVEAKAGSRDSLGRLLRRYETRVRRAVWGVLRNAEDVEDCLQETHARVTASIHTFRDHAPFGPWIRRVAINTAISALRRARGRGAVALPSEVTATECGPAEQLIAAQLARHAHAALATLPASHRQVLELRLIRGLPHSEIAEILRVPSSSARVLYVRALQRLRKAVRGAG